MNTATDTQASKMTTQEREFYEKLRNPFERATKAVSDVLQGFLKAVDGLIPSLD